MIKWTPAFPEASGRSYEARPRPTVVLQANQFYGESDFQWSFSMGDDCEVEVVGAAQTMDEAKAAAEAAWKQWLRDALAEAEDAP